MALRTSVRSVIGFRDLWRVRKGPPRSHCALLEEFLELVEEPALAIEDLLQALLAARAAF